MKLMSRIEDSMTRLETLIAEAQKVTEDSKVATDVRAAALGFVNRLTSITSAEGYDPRKVASVGQSLEVALANAQRVVDGLAKVTGADRSEGDSLAKALNMACEANWLEGDDRGKAEALIASWAATAPKGSSKGSRGQGTGSGASTGKALPFPVKVTCEADGWTATQGTNVNSLRWAAILHHADKHGHKPARGEAIHQGLTEAINSVADGKSLHAQGGGYLVDKSA